MAQWRDAFLIQAGISDAKTFPMLVLANKVDIQDRKVSSKEARDWCMWVWVLFVDAVSSPRP